NVIWCHYTRLGVNDLCLDADLIINPSEVHEFLTVHLYVVTGAFVSPPPKVLSAALEQTFFRGASIEPASAVLAPVIGQLGFARAKRGDVVDALTLDANYVRRSDAELLWKGP